MKKSLIMLSAVAAFSTVSFASDMNKEMLNQIQALKAQIEALEKKVSEQETKPVVQQTVVDEKRIEKIEKKLLTARTKGGINLLRAARKDGGPKGRVVH